MMIMEAQSNNRHVWDSIGYLMGMDRLSVVVHHTVVCSYSMYVIQGILWQHHDCNAEEIPLSLGALAGFLLLCTSIQI